MSEYLQSELPAIELFKNLEYEYLDAKGEMYYGVAHQSITMIYLATKLRATTSGFDNPTILVLTDRTDLDNQIRSTFNRVRFSNINQANSISHLKTLLIS